MSEEYSDQKRKGLFNGTALDYVRMRADKHEKVYHDLKQATHLRKLADEAELQGGCNMTEMTDEELGEAIQSAYDEGYEQGREDGYGDGEEEGYKDGQDDARPDNLVKEIKRVCEVCDQDGTRPGVLCEVEKCKVYTIWQAILDYEL